MNKENNSKVSHLAFNLYSLDMIFSEDAIIMSLLERYEDEEEVKEAVLKYCNGGILEAKRPDVIEAPKGGDPNELDMVTFHHINLVGIKSNRHRSRF